MLVPVPRTGGSGGSGSSGSPLGAPALRDADLVAWCQQLVEAVFGD